MKTLTTIFVAIGLAAGVGACTQHQYDEQQLNSFKDRFRKHLVEAMRNTISLEEATQVADYMKEHAKDQ